MYHPYQANKNTNKQTLTLSSAVNTDKWSISQWKVNKRSRKVKIKI